MVRKEDGEERAMMKKEDDEKKKTGKRTSSMVIYISPFILTSACNTKEGALHRMRTLLSKEIASHKTPPKTQNSVHVGCDMSNKHLFSPSSFGLLSTIYFLLAR